MGTGAPTGGYCLSRVCANWPIDAGLWYSRYYWHARETRDMALTHRCPNGKATKLVRTGPAGTLEGVTFTCPSCGQAKTAATIERESDAIMATVAARLTGSR